MAKENADVVYVSNLAVHGFLNGVVNLCFQTAEFLPALDKDGKPAVATADYISANLRMDLNVAQQVRDVLDKIIEENTRPKVTN